MYIFSRPLGVNRRYPLIIYTAKRENLKSEQITTLERKHVNEKGNDSALSALNSELSADSRAKNYVGIFLSAKK